MDAHQRRDDVGDSGYGVPYNVEEEKIELLEHDVNFIMAIETGGMFDRLIETALTRISTAHWFTSRANPLVPHAAFSSG